MCELLLCSLRFSYLFWTIFEKMGTIQSSPWDVEENEIKRQKGKSKRGKGRAYNGVLVVEQTIFGWYITFVHSSSKKAKSASKKTSGVQCISKFSCSVVFLRLNFFAFCLLLLSPVYISEFSNSWLSSSSLFSMFSTIARLQNFFLILLDFAE